jgi:DNA-binding transcriptional MerR regulator
LRSNKNAFTDDQKPWYNVGGFDALGVSLKEVNSKISNDMPSPYLRTTDIAKELGVHANTVRLYESRGFLPAIPRGENGYRQYSARHLEQARLAHLTLRWPYLGTRALLVDLVKSAAQDDFGTAMDLAYQYLGRVRVARTYAEVAMAFVERWAAGHLMDIWPQQMSISRAAQHLNVTTDMLRNWERNGLIEVPRDPSNQYRLYGAAEFARIRVIRILVQSGYSLMAILRMLQQFDAGQTDNLRAALELPRAESADEAIEIMADRWLSSLQELEQRAEAIIQQIGHMIELVRSR